MPEVKVHELPKALSEWIQEKASSGLDGVRVGDKVIPVFLINPADYAGVFSLKGSNWKLRLHKVTGLDDTTTLLCAEVSGEERKHVLIQNLDAANACYIGYSGVTGLTGYKLTAGESVEWHTYRSIYVIAGSGESVEVRAAEFYRSTT